MIQGILEKLFKAAKKQSQPEEQTLRQADVEALIDAKLKEHAANVVQPTETDTIQKGTSDQDDYKLTAKQVEYALSLIAKLNGEYVLAIEPSQLTLKDFNRLIGYNRYKNKGILVNLVKKGILKK